MKKLTILLVLLFCLVINAQQWNGSTNATGFISRSGNVSVGTTIKVDRFNLADNLRMINGSIKFGNIFTDPFTFSADSYFQINMINSNSMLNIYPSPDNILDVSGNQFIPKTFVLAKDENIGMGTDIFTCTDCANYRLFVKDGIRTEKIKVDIAANNGWADYVFKKDYKLMPLKEVESFISKNGHLPEVPSTDEAMKNGIELKEMNILLLKKIEELTLYSIDQNKRIDALEKKLNENK